ncbi:hypothetical protein BDZ97DRAFT_272862 [Flammula alnicola]|nr:hypothetical protein BDZ97DRAFT_272862 [Flammula alnicola]
MRGLAFPPNATVDREASYEYGTPISNVDDIPIDPALGGAAIDPALMMEDGGSNVVRVSPPEPQPENQHLQHQQPPSDDYQIRQYSQGPQGDPFAPQIPAPFFPIEQEEPLPPPKPKRKRKVHREEDCSFCQGNEERNKRGEPESMVTCHECGRSGHPSCMELEKLGDVVLSYPWKCIECKNCEVCQEKGDDERILFCDWCDRGWHMDCMEPPLQTPPEGDWRCPVCPPIIPEEELLSQQHPQPEDAQQSSVASVREPSVASTSRSAAEAPLPTTKGRKGKKNAGKGRTRGVPKVAVVSDGSDNDDPVDVVDSPVLPRNRGRLSRPSAKAKARAPTISSDEEPEARPARPPKRRRPRESSPPPPTVPRVRLRLPPRGKGKEREEDDGPHGLFDDILGIEERDTSKTTPTNTDKLLFERSRVAAEEKLVVPPPPTASSSRNVETNERSTPLTSRPLRSAALQQLSTPLTKNIDFSNSPVPSTPGGSLPKFEPGVLRIRTIRFGPYDIKTWYDAPFPEEYASIPDGRLWICEFCLKYMKSRFKAIRHQMKCKARHPPGDEIYWDGSVSIFEVDGRRNKIYCQNLCLLSKMFLDHKSLFYDVEPFLFYVITQVDDFGARFVGYFSKEKRCPKDYNLSCIMTLPVRQRQGWGNLLIDFSYLLSKIEQRLGSPEKPLSSLGALGYKNYWTLAVMRYLEKAPDNVRLEAPRHQ